MTPGWPLSSGEAVRACTTLKALSITGALLPMAELLDSSVRLDLSGRGLGRVEMGIAAQLLHNNSSLQVLKLSDNPIGQFGMETLADAVAHARPPLTEAHLGNLGIRSGQQVQRFLRALRHYRAPLRVLDLHGNCLLPPLGDEIADPQLWLQSTPETDDFNEWCDTTLAALAEVCNLLEMPGNQLTRLVLSHTMESPHPDTSPARRSAGTVLEALRNLAVRRLCAALGSEHCALTELSILEFGFTPENVELLAPPLRRPGCAIQSLRLSEWAMHPRRLLDEAGALTFGKADGRATDAVLACALLTGEPGLQVRSMSLEYIGNRLERSGFQAVCRLLEGRHLPNLRVLSLRHAAWLTKKQIAAILRAISEAISEGACQLHELILSQTHLCVTAFGHYSVDAVRVLCAMLCTPGNCLRKLDLRGTCLCGTTLDAATGYTLEGIGVLCTALAHPHCALEHLELSENAIRADREEQAPSTLPLPLYKIGKTDVERLAALHPDVRLAMLRSLDYPALFREAAQRKGLVLPSLESLASMEAKSLIELWNSALRAEAELEAPSRALDSASARAEAPIATEGGHPLSLSSALADEVAQRVVEQAQRGGLPGGEIGPDDIEFLRQALSSTHLPAELQHSELNHRHERYERGYPYLAASERHTSLMAKHLTPELYDELKDQRTATGITIDDVIRPGVRLPDHPIGALAAESECYETFPALFDVLVHDWHGWHRSQSPSHKSDIDASKLEIPGGWHQAAATCLRGIRIDVRRNFVGWMFTPSLNVTGRAGVERASQAFFEQLSEEHVGKYHPLVSIDEPTRTRLRAEEIYFETPDLRILQAGAGAAPCSSSLAEWDVHRGVYRSISGQFAVMVNEEDHLRMIVRREDGDLLEGFHSLCSALGALDRSHAATAGIAVSPRRGALTVSPANLGTGMRVTLTLRLPHLGRDPTALEAICSQLLRQAAGTDALVKRSTRRDDSGDTVGSWEVSTKASVGASEVQLVQGCIYLTTRLAELDARLASGLSLLQAMTPPPPAPAAPIQLAAAVHRSPALQTLCLSGRPLRVRDWVGGSDHLVVAGLLPSQDALLLAHLLRQHTRLRSLDVSHCRLTSAISLELVHALGASLLATCPPLLTDLRLAGNRLRTAGALALIDVLVASRCPLALLDLSSTELCGGTMALPRLFGDLRASTAKVGDEGHSATYARGQSWNGLDCIRSAWIASC